MEHGPPRRRRARPVADAPVDALLLRAEDLAKGWLLALLEVVALDDAPAILAADLPREGPRLCEAVVRAIADDVDLRRLGPGGALEPLAARAGELAGAADPLAAVRAVDALQAVIWAGLRSELADPDADLMVQLAERLTLAIEHVRAAVMGGLGASESRRSPREEEPRPRSVLRVTRSHGESGGGPEAGGGQQSGPPPVDGPDGDALWVAAVQEEIAAVRRAGAPLALILAELEDGSRLELVEGPEPAAASFGRFAQALRGAIRRRDLLACETDTRAWVIARETGRVAARALAERMALAVEQQVAWRGAPMRLVAGVAMLGEDGNEAVELIEAAEEAKFAAAARGVPVMPGPRPATEQHPGPRPLAG